ncbi:MAG: hypothetical protein AB1521_12865 [Bacteroidota bacterium]
MKALYNKEQQTSGKNYLPWIFSVLLLPLIIYLVFNEGKFFIVDYVNLLIHEGGHGIFSIFGIKYLHALGGTITQLLIPTMFVVFYFLKKKRITTQIFLIWLGQNFINVSVYVADARAQKLPLLGGNKVYHDWNYLLGEIGLLEYDNIVGQVFYFLGIAAFVISLLIPIIIRDYKTAKIDLGL